MIRLLTNCDAPEVKVYLERNYMETVLFSGNIAKCCISNDGVNRRAGDYYGYFSEGRLQGILSFYNLGNVVVHFETEAAIGSFAEIIKQRRFEMLVGLKKMVEPLCLAVKPTKSVLGCEESYLFVNHTRKPYALNFTHEIADVEAVDRSIALSFIVEAYRQGFQRRFNQELAVRLINERGSAEAFVFLLIDKVPVAQAGIQVVTGQIAQIGGVYTNEHHRGKGYCKALVAELCRRIHTVGKIPTLMVKRNNAPAIRAYLSLGFTYCDDYQIAKYRV